MDRRCLVLAPMLIVIIAGCGGSRARSDSASAGATTDVPSGVSASGGTHVIHWQDDLTYGKYLLENEGLTKAQIDAVECGSKEFGHYFFKVFNEAGVAVTSDVEATADAAKVREDNVTFTCHYTVDMTVDDAKRYRAERTASSYEASSQYPTVLEYSFIETSTLAGSGWVWSSTGGSKKAV